MKMQYIIQITLTGQPLDSLEIRVWKEEGPLWNLGIFISTISIIFIVVFFSIWIMNHLNYNMMS